MVKINNVKSTTWQQLAGIGCLGAFLTLTTGCPSDATDGNPKRPTQNTGALEKAEEVEPPETPEWTVKDAQEAMTTGKLTAVELTESYIARIARIDEKLNSIIALVPGALEEAQQRDDERGQGRVRSALHGIPVVIKDNIAVAGMPNTAGSLALQDFSVVNEAPLVAALREAGAVILAKTNLSEWANFRGRRSSSGWSAVGGQTRNPYVLDRNPCGSSSGSGVAIAANLAVVALGTETDGSIACPSSVNGIVGLKPTVGKLSTSGVIPISPSQDAVGPMARHVADLAAAFAALTDDERRLEPRQLSGLRIGVARERAEISLEVSRVFDAALQRLSDAGVELVDVELARPDPAVELEVLVTEMGPAMASYLKDYTPEPAPKTMMELVNFNHARAEEELRWFDQHWFEQAAAAQEPSAPDFVARRQKNQQAARAAIDDALAENEVTLVVLPTASPAWPIDLINGDHILGGNSDTSAVAGYPLVSLPMGTVEGLPVGMTLIASADDEWTLLNVAASFEGVLPAREPPEYLDTLPLPSSE